LQPRLGLEPLEARLPAPLRDLPQQPRRLDALARLSTLSLDSSGHMPICVPVWCSRIWIATGVNERTLLGRKVMLRAGAIRQEGENTFTSYADATTSDGRLLLVLQEGTARRMGLVRV